MEEIEVFSPQKLPLFEINKHTDTIRMIYEDILCMEKEINIVLEKLKGMWQIAESNNSKYMLIKASWTAQLQIASEHANCEGDDLVLQGTAEKSICI